MSAASDNAMAAAGARSALTGLGDFIFRQKVQKPLLEAQTENVAAQTDAERARTAGIRLMNPLDARLKTLQSRMAEAQLAGPEKQNFLDSLESPQNLFYTPQQEKADEPSFAAPAPAPAPAKQTKQQPTDAFSAPSTATPIDWKDNPNLFNSYTGPKSNKMPSGLPALDQSIFKASSILAPSATAASDFQAASAQKLREVRPTPVIPQLTSERTSAPASTATTADRKAAAQPTTETPSGTPVGSVVQVTQPKIAKPAAPVRYSPTNFLTTPFDENPESIKEALLKHAHEQAALAGVKVTDADIISQYHRNQSKAMQSMTPASAARAGLVLIGYDKDGPKYARPFGTNGSIMFDEGIKLSQALNDKATDHPAVKTAVDVFTAVQEVMEQASLANAKGAANQSLYDQALMTSFIKTIDPTIRAKFGTNEELIVHAPLSQKLKDAALRTLTGQRLSSDEREAFVKAAGANLKSALGSANTVIDRLNQQGSDIGLGANIVRPLVLGTPGAASGGLPANAVHFQSPEQIRALPTGQNIPVVMPDGKIFWKR